MSEKKIAVVTGGSRGIGRAIACDLVKRGFQVHFTFVKDETAANALAEELGGKAIPSRVDARDAAACSAYVEKLIAEQKRIDVLVNNAGIITDRLLAMMTFEDWQSVLNTSLNGLFGMTHRTAKQMMGQKSGRIINLTSVSGVMGIAGQTAYASAKGAIIAFTRALSKELARSGVPVNAVAPGFIETDMLSALSAKQKESWLERVAMRRLGTSEEISGFVGYLAADAPTYLTGQTIVIDGGLT